MTNGYVSRKCLKPCTVIVVRLVHASPIVRSIGSMLLTEASTTAVKRYSTDGAS
jgi:hypothetical protein